MGRSERLRKEGGEVVGWCNLAKGAHDRETSDDSGCGGCKMVSVGEMSSLSFYLITWPGDIQSYIFKVILIQWLCCWHLYNWHYSCGSVGLFKPRFDQFHCSAMEVAVNHIEDMQQGRPDTQEAHFL